MKACWIVDPAYNGKGECDGRGAFLKKSARIHVLREDGFLDNAQQLVTFWDSLPGGGATLLNFSYDDIIEDVATITGVKSCYDFIFTNDTGTLKMRKWPCVCQMCLAFNFDECSELHITGAWKSKATKVIGNIRPKGTSPPINQPMEDDGVHYEVERIVGKCTFQGALQYKIQWLRWAEEFDEWKDISKLNCEELTNECENQAKYNL